MNDPVANPESSASSNGPPSPARRVETTLGPLLDHDTTPALAALWDALGFHPTTNPFRPSSSVGDAAARPVPPNLATIVNNPEGIAAHWIRWLPPEIRQHPAVHPCSDGVLVLGQIPPATAPPAPSTTPPEPPAGNVSPAPTPAASPAIHVAFGVESSGAAPPALPDAGAATLALVASGAVPILALVQPVASDSLASLHSRLRQFGFRETIELPPPGDPPGSSQSADLGTRLLLLGRRDSGKSALPQEFQADDDAIVLVSAAPPAADVSPTALQADETAVLRDGLLALTHGDSLRSARVVGRDGLAEAVASCCGLSAGAGSNPRGASLDLAPMLPPDDQATPAPARMEEVWFGPLANRVLVSTAPLDAGKLLAQAKILGLSGVVIGKVGGSSLSAKCGTWAWPTPAPTPPTAPVAPVGAPIDPPTSTPAG